MSVICVRAIFFFFLSTSGAFFFADCQSPQHHEAPLIQNTKGDTLLTHAHKHADQEISQRPAD